MQPQRTTHVRYGHPLITSLLIGIAQEADLVSPGLNNRQRFHSTQPWTSLCITASNGSSFLAAHHRNGYALRACHQMMMSHNDISVSKNE